MRTETPNCVTSRRDLMCRDGASQQEQTFSSHAGSRPGAHGVTSQRGQDCGGSQEYGKDGTDGVFFCSFQHIASKYSLSYMLPVAFIETFFDPSNNFSYTDTVSAEHAGSSSAYNAWRINQTPSLKIRRIGCGSCSACS